MVSCEIAPVTYTPVLVCEPTEFDLRHAIHDELPDDLAAHLRSCAPEVRHTFSDIRTYTLENELLAHKILDQPVGSLLAKTESLTTASRRAYVANRLSKRGITSARDLLVVGRQSATVVDKLGDTSHEMIGAAMEKLAVEHPLFTWYDTPPDAMIARWCSGTDQVNARVIHPSLWQFNVADLATHPHILHNMYNRDRNLVDGLEKRRDQFVKTFVTVRRMLAVRAVELL